MNWKNEELAHQIVDNHFEVLKTTNSLFTSRSERISARAEHCSLNSQMFLQGRMRVPGSEE